MRASCGLGTSGEDVDALLAAVHTLAEGAPAPVPYVQDEVTGDFWPEGQASGGDRPIARAAPPVPGAEGRRGNGSGRG